MTKKAGAPRRESLLFKWRDAFCSPDGPPAITRLILWTLSKHMAMNGANAFPNQDTIAQESGLGLRTVKEHLERAEKLGWIAREPRRRGDRRSWRYGTDYVPRFPVVNGAADAPMTTEAQSMPATHGNGAADANIGAAHATLVRQPPTSSSGNSSLEVNACRKEGITHATAAGREVQKRRAARDEFVDAYEAEERRVA